MKLLSDRRSALASLVMRLCRASGSLSMTLA
jgi:hypothetical protein